MSNAPTTFAQVHSDDAAGNRLRIAHFLLWLAATAVVLTAFRPALSESVFPARAAAGLPFASADHFAAFLAIATIAPIWGAALAGLGLAGWRRLCGGPPFPIYPGHWLLLVVGSGALVLLPFPELARLSGSLAQPRSLVLGVAPCIALSIMLATLIVATIRHRSSSPWQPLFLALAISCGVLLLGLAWDVAASLLRERNELVLALLGFAWTMVFLAALMARSIADLAQQRRYDDLHWVGIGLMPAHAAWLLVWIAAGANAA